MQNLTSQSGLDSEITQAVVFKDAHETAIATLQLVVHRMKQFDDTTSMETIMQLLEKMGKVIESINSIGKILNLSDVTITRGGADIAPFEIPIKQMQ